jgi:hypothetical protein
MINPVHNNISQTQLNPFQKRVDDQVKQNETKDAQAGSSLLKETGVSKSENKPAQQASPRQEEDTSQKSARARGSIIDIEV